MARFNRLHDWPKTPAEAIALQERLRSAPVREPLAGPVRTIAGCDISFDRGSPIVHAAVIVLRLPELTPIAEAGAVAEAPFPYVPGLLTFRELPPLLEAWAKLPVEPDAVMIDGHGYAHPRRLGIAAHAGLWLDRPTFGCGKSVLVGRYAEPGPKPGDRSDMLHKGEVVGVALRTKARAGPVYVSAGHRIDLAGALQLTLACLKGYRIPEPTRRAHLLVNALRTGERTLL